MTFSQQINMDATRNHDMSNTTSSAIQKPYVGQKFNDMKSMQHAVKIYSVKSHYTLMLFYLSAKHDEYRCPEYGISCNWRVQACHLSCEHFWEITIYNGNDTCLLVLLSKDHQKLDTNVISSFIVTMVTKNPKVFIHQIIEKIHSIYGYTPSYKKAWKGKH